MAIAYFLGWIWGLVRMEVFVPDDGAAGWGAVRIDVFVPDEGDAGAGRMPVWRSGAGAGGRGTAAAPGFAPDPPPATGTFFSSACWTWLQVDTYTKIWEPETRSSFSKISGLSTLEIATS